MKGFGQGLVGRGQVGCASDCGTCRGIREAFALQIKSISLLTAPEPQNFGSCGQLPLLRIVDI